ncbi:protein ZINC INDUCED FACILITATOR 1-like isoform X1 [Aristolochia californica]|uniref:protein ZINC INDUCED FACILITATOR 1-like isoform X1 n=1 Tax=Aristolochia californica TaxID=171875 RepID=UPI0035D64049
MANAEQPLLKKIYYENCPGCEQEQRNELRRGIPYKEFVFVAITVLCASLPISSLFPFLYFMVRDLHIAKREEDIGYYAGYIGSSYMLGRALTSVLWGMVADRFGRKPVVLFGSLSVVVFNALFGLSSSFWMAITMRFLLGSLSGILGPIRAYATEVCREEYQALGLSIVSTAWGLGLIIGPALGGFLAQPAEKYPTIFNKDSIFGRFPYFLPCLCISIYAIGVTISCRWLPETLHKHNAESREDSHPDGDTEYALHDSGLNEGIEEAGQNDPTSNGNLLKNWPLISSIIVYCIFQLHDMAYAEIFSLWAFSDTKYGGLGFSSDHVGLVLAISGLGLLIFQLLLYPMVEKILGPMKVSRLAAVLSIPLLASYPYIAVLSGVVLSCVINCASMLKNVLSVTITTGLFILQNNAVTQKQRGTASGLALTAQSFFKAVGPVVGGALFSWAQKRVDASFLPGNQMVFLVLNIVELAGLLMTFKPFLAIPSNYRNSYAT